MPGGREPGTPRALLGARRGSMMPLLAMGAGVLAGVGALGVDAGWLYLQHDRLQQEADSVALAGARQLPDETAARHAAIDFAVRVLGEDEALLRPDDIAIGSWNAEQRRFVSGGTPADAMQVDLLRTRARGNAVKTFMAGVLGVDAIELAVSAVARRAVPTCIHVLDPTGGKALSLTGGASIAVPDCSVQVNSDAANALDATGQSRIEAQSICVAGDYDFTGGAGTTPPPQAGCRALDDPLAGFVPPEVGTCDWTNRKIRGAEVLAPGVYCGGISLTGGASATLQPGIYVIRNGDLKVTGKSSLSGTGVGFYLTGSGASVQLTGSGRIDLSAPIGGPMAGFVFAAGADVPDGTGNKLSGGGEMRFVGALYFPRQELTLTGGSEGLSPSPFTLLVAWQIKLTGGGTLRFGADPDHSTVPPAFHPRTAPVVVR